ncbi:MAG TPA: bifunctional adenosylcobinamide kinase/adenosylcobinamide-phosphate guanylyltransferase [Syntrophothermus lipocalidus]|nr:bifunctional adenosylcobinamide kinase/adenosylcobinamide-phosphate guanylyltransferase [Syntrophothermus lipocalidus]
MVLVTGGARSGKSRWAEYLLQEQGGGVLYVATALPIDEEMQDRINRHRTRRPPHWRTLEGYSGLARLIRETRLFREAVLLDCLTIMVTNLLLDAVKDFDRVTPQEAETVEKGIEQEVVALVKALREIESTAVIVTNEVGMGLVPDNPLGRLFRDVCGRMNQLVAAEADEVYLVVSGIPLRIK